MVSMLILCLSFFAASAMEVSKEKEELVAQEISCAFDMLGSARFALTLLNTMGITPVQERLQDVAKEDCESLAVKYQQRINLAQRAIQRVIRYRKKPACAAHKLVVLTCAVQWAHKECIKHCLLKYDIDSQDLLGLFDPMHCAYRKLYWLAMGLKPSSIDAELYENFVWDYCQRYRSIAYDLLRFTIIQKRLSKKLPKEIAAIIARYTCFVEPLNIPLAPVLKEKPKRTSRKAVLRTSS